MYDYTTADSQPVYDVVRFEPKEYRPRQPNGKWGYGNVERVLYNLPDVAEGVKNNKLVYLVEGEKTAEALRCLGIVTTTIPGGANGKWFPQFAAALRNAHVVILRDQDDAGHHYGERAAGELYGIAASVKIIDLPSLVYRESHGDDPEDWVTQGGTLDKLLRIIQSTPTWQPMGNANSVGIRLVRPEEIIAQPPIDYLVPDIIPQRALVSLFGASGIGKSFTTLDWALSIAQQKHAIYMPYEGKMGYGTRLRAWMRYHGRSCGKFLMVDNPISLMNKHEVDQLIEAMWLLEPGVLIVDTLARAMQDGDENSAKDMGQLVEACNRIQRETGAAVVLVHHSNKSGGERGSSALRGAADMMIEMTADDGLITMKCAKSKDAPPFIPRHFRLHEVELEGGTSSCVLVPADRTQMALEQRFGRNGATVLLVLAHETARKTGMGAGDLMSQTEVPAGSIHRVLKDLKEDDMIHQPEDRGPYFITEKGLQFIAGSSRKLH